MKEGNREKERRRTLLFCSKVRRMGVSFLLLALFSVFLFSSFAFAIPVPTGVAGTITGDNASSSVVLIVAYEVDTESILDSNIVNSFASVEGGRFAGVLSLEGGTVFDLSVSVLPGGDELLTVELLEENVLAGQEQFFDFILEEQSSDSGERSEDSSESDDSEADSSGGSSGNKAGSAIQLPVDSGHGEASGSVGEGGEDIPLTDDQWSELQEEIKDSDEEHFGDEGASSVVEEHTSLGEHSSLKPSVGSSFVEWWQSEVLVLQLLLFSMIMTVTMILYLLVKKDEDEEDEEDLGDEDLEENSDITYTKKVHPKSLGREVPLGMKIPTFFVTTFFVCFVFLGFVVPVVLAAPTPVGITGHLIGPEHGGADINATLYEVGTSNKLASETTTSFANGSYFLAPTAPDGTSEVDIVVTGSNSGGEVYGENDSYTSISVNDNPDINVSMHSNLTLVTPVNNSFTNNNTFFQYIWNYTASFFGNFIVQLDTNDQFLNPLTRNITGVSNDSTQYNETIAALSDGAYYWRVYSYNDSQNLVYDYSDVFNFTIDATPPILSSFSPQNGTWKNDTDVLVSFVTNEAASCRWDNDTGVAFASKDTLFAGSGSTSHSDTIDYSLLSGQGENIIYLQCNDTLGNLNLTDVVYSVNIDSIDPNTTSNFSSLNGTWLASSTTISLLEDDPAPSSGINWTQYCTTASCSPSSGTNYTGPVTISTEGSSVFRFASYDIAGNLQNTSELTVQIDTEAPNTTDNFTFDNTWINFDAEISLFPEDPNASVGDGSGLNWTRYCYSSEDYACTPDTDYTGTVTISDENITYFRYHSGDNVSNTQTIQTLIVKIDSTDSVTTSNFTQNSTWVDGPVDVYLSASDTVAGRNVSGMNWTQYCTSAACDPSTGSDYGAGPIPISTEGASVFRYTSADNASNVESSYEWNIQIDTEAPNTTDNFTFDDTWINFNAEISLFPEDPNASVGDGSGLNWTRYCYSSEDYACTPDTDYTGTVTISDENITYFRYHSADNVSNTQAIQTLIVKIDTSAPDEGGASVAIDSDAVYSTDRVLDFTWSGFTDAISGRNVSGISGYYYNFTNHETTSGGSLDSSSPGQLTATGDGNWTVFVWAQDNVSTTGPNIGNAVNSSIFVDTVGPSYLAINQTNITEDNGGVNFTFTINITEDGSGHAFVPLFRYRYNQSTSYSAWTTLTENGGDEYELQIEAPSWGWNLNRFQNVSLQINATDFAGNENISEEFLEFVDDSNDAPILDLISNQTVSQGGLLTFNLTGSDVDDDGIESVTLTYSSNFSNLTILKINNTLAEVNWTPGNEYVGENYVNFTLSDGSLSDSQEVLLNVTNVNDAPVLDVIPNMTAYENVSFSQDINATDADLQALIYDENTSLFVINSSDGTFSFTPVNNDVGNHTILFNVSDGSGGVDSQEVLLEILDVYSELNFTLQDRIFSTLLDNATLTGGDSCSGGCDFNESIFRFQTNGNIEFNLTAAGYSTNSTTYSITSDQNHTILLEDEANPSIGDASVAYFVNDSGFYLNITVNASDNLAVENVTFDYAIDAHNASIIDTSGMSNMTLMSENEHFLILGPYTYSFDLTSNQTALDYYGNSNVSLNDRRIYIYISNGSSVSVNTAPVLASIGNLTATVEKPFSYTAVAADAEGDALTFAENSTLFTIDASGGNLSFTPNSSQTGNYTVHFNVSDGALIDEETTTLEVITSVCGDLFCSSSETCSSCSADCGTCPSSSSSSSSSGGGGGGGGGGSRTVTEYVNQTVEVEVEVETIVVVNETCVNNFTCSDWVPVVCETNGIQERSCYDANACSNHTYVESQSCSYIDESVNEGLLFDEGGNFFDFLFPARSFFNNIVGWAWGGEDGFSKPLTGVITGILLLALLTPLFVWKVNHKAKRYEISDLHAIIDGHHVHIRSIVAANTPGTKAEILEQWEADVDEYVYEDRVAKV